MNPLLYFFAISDSKWVDSTLPSSAYLTQLDQQTTALRRFQDLIASSSILSLSLIPTYDLKTLQLLAVSSPLPIGNITAIIEALTSYKRLTNAFHAENASLSGMIRVDS